MRGRDTNDARPVLSPREREVLARLCRGDSEKAIARSLGIAPGTVHVHLQTIYRKLAVRGRVQAAMAGVARGVCPVPRAPERG